MKQYQKTFHDYPKEGRIYGKWFTVEKDGSPPDFEVVIVEYSGMWPNRGAGGITDLYWYKNDCFNYPDWSGVKIERWMWIPEE